MQRSSKSADLVLPGSGSDIAIVLFITGSAGTKNRVLTGSWCMAFLYKTPENLLISGFATDLATPGRMYILTLSMMTYSDVGLKCILS
jgi:hypothetical protein